MNLELLIPSKDKLTFRKQLVEDPKTMEYNHGIVPFPEEKWDTWYMKWIGNNDSKYFYAYILDKEIGEYVGEVAYRYDEESDTVILNIIIDYNQRGKGYGKLGLRELVKTAFKNGYNEVRDLVGKDNYSSQEIFKNFGFKIVGKDTDGSIDFRLTKDEFINIYGNLD